MSNTLCPLSLFPYTVSDNVFVSGAMFTRGLHVRNVFATERYIQIVVERGKSEGSQDNCFASPVFQWGPQLGRNSQKTMVHGPWNNCMMKAMVPTQQRHQVLLLKATFVFFFLITACAPWLKLLTMTDSSACFVYDYGVNSCKLYKYLGIQIISSNPNKS